MEDKKFVSIFSHLNVSVVSLVAGLVVAYFGGVYVLLTSHPDAFLAFHSTLTWALSILGMLAMFVFLQFSFMTYVDFAKNVDSVRLNIDMLFRSFEFLIVVCVAGAVFWGIPAFLSSLLVQS